MVSMLANLYGTPNISLGHVMGCEGDRRVATLTLFGDIFPMHDFENSRYVMLWGMNIFGANQGLFESRGLADAQSRGCKLVVLDPSFSETAQKADEWIPIRPGTDGALAPRDVPRHRGGGSVRPRLRQRALLRIRRLPRPPPRTGLYTGVGGAHHGSPRRDRQASCARVRHHEACDGRPVQGAGLLHQRYGREPRHLPARCPDRRGRQARQPQAERVGPARAAGGHTEGSEGPVREQAARARDGISACPAHRISDRARGAELPPARSGARRQPPIRCAASSCRRPIRS